MSVSKGMSWMLLAGLVVIVAACGSDSTTGGDGGGGTPQSDLLFPQLGLTAPPLCSDTVGAWFHKTPGGPDQELALQFREEGGTDCTGGETEDFLRLKLKGSSLLRYPNGDLISDGDSVFISIAWVGNDSVLFNLQPSGLQFDPANPAQLKIEYGECGDDLNHDGNVNNEDGDIEKRLDIWRQEQVGDPWFRVGTAKIEEDKEIEARLNGFSRFALAY